jgi:hypothetical protein
VQVRTPREAIQLLEQHQVHALSLHDAPESHNLIHWLIKQTESSAPDRWPSEMISFHGHATPVGDRQLAAAIERHSERRGRTLRTPHEAHVGG